MTRQRTSTSAEIRKLTTLLEAVGRGNTRAFAELHALTRRKLRRTATAVSPSDIDDVLQESYLKIWRAAASFDSSRASPISWMCIIVRNTALDAARARKLPGTELEHAMAIPAPVEDVEEFDFDLARRIAIEAMSGLPEDRRRLLSLAYFDGASRLSLAEQFDVPVGTIKTWLRRAVESVRADCLAAAKASAPVPT